MTTKEFYSVQTVIVQQVTGWDTNQVIRVLVENDGAVQPLIWLCAAILGAIVGVFVFREVLR